MPEMLETDPENLTALKHFLKLNRYNDEEEGAWFVKLLSATMKRDFQSGVRLVRDYYPRHLNLLSGDIFSASGWSFTSTPIMRKHGSAWNWLQEGRSLAEQGHAAAEPHLRGHRE